MSDLNVSAPQTNVIAITVIMSRINVVSTPTYWSNHSTNMPICLLFHIKLKLQI